jgi:prefoldin subunit 5
MLKSFPITTIAWLILTFSVMGQSPPPEKNKQSEMWPWLLSLAGTVMVTWLINSKLNQGQQNASIAAQYQTDQSVNSAFDPVKQQIKNIEARLDQFDKFQILSEERYHRQIEFNKDVVSEKIANACTRVEERLQARIDALSKQTQDNMDEVSELKGLMRQYIESNRKMFEKLAESDLKLAEEIRGISAKTDVLSELVVKTNELLSRK